MTFRANTPISTPVDDGKYKTRRDMGGFGWHPDKGMFIPISEPIEYFDKPYPSGLTVKKIPNV